MTGKGGLSLSHAGPSSQVMALGIVPMCSYQMERMFNTTRIPGKETGTGHNQEPVVGPSRRSSLLPSSGPAMAGHPTTCSSITKHPGCLRAMQL